MRLGRKSRNEPDDSQKALDEAKQHVIEIDSRTAEVKEVAESLRQVRKQNHFAEQLYDILSNQGRRAH